MAGYHLFANNSCSWGIYVEMNDPAAMNRTLDVETLRAVKEEFPPVSDCK